MPVGLAGFSHHLVSLCHRMTINYNVLMIFAAAAAAAAALVWSTTRLLPRGCTNGPILDLLSRGSKLQNNFRSSPRNYRCIETLKTARMRLLVYQRIQMVRCLEKSFERKVDGKPVRECLSVRTPHARTHRRTDSTKT